MAAVRLLGLVMQRGDFNRIEPYILDRITAVVERSIQNMQNYSSINLHAVLFLQANSLLQPEERIFYNPLPAIMEEIF